MDKETIIEEIVQITKEKTSLESELSKLRYKATEIQDKIDSQHTMLNNKLEIIDRIDRGLSRKTCNNCDGTGKVHSHNPLCWVCGGRGFV